MAYPVKVHYYKGTEQLELNGKKLGFNMIDFWRNELSSIMDTMTRGTFSEYLVACAMELHGFHALQQNKLGHEAWDLDGPKIMTAEGKRESRIEVKSTANVHIELEEDERKLRESQLKFSIRKAIDWYHEALGKRRHSDVYVFCYYTATKKSQNMLDVGLWEFYVLPTWEIDEDPYLQGRNSVSLYRLHEMGLKPIRFEALYDEIKSALKTVEDHGAKQ